MEISTEWRSLRDETLPSAGKWFLLKQLVLSGDASAKSVIPDQESSRQQSRARTEFRLARTSAWIKASTEWTWVNVNAGLASGLQTLTNGRAAGAEVKAVKVECLFTILLPSFLSSLLRVPWQRKAKTWLLLANRHCVSLRRLFGDKTELIEAV